MASSLTEKAELVDLAVCLPLVLLMNFSLFQYLVTTFWKRRCERRVRLLLFLAALSFVSLIPFAFPDKELVRDLNDISEVCSVLTFLLQITILTRDVGKRIKIRSIWVLMWVGEALVVASLAVLVSNLLDIVAPVIDMSAVEKLDEVVENVSLLFIVGFRFYFLAIAKGYRKVLATQKTEIACYVLFLTHEYPFYVLDHITEWSWEHVQGVWMRLTICACLGMTIRARMTSQSSKLGITTTHGPKTSQFENLSVVRKAVEKKEGTTKHKVMHKGSILSSTMSTFAGRTSMVAVAPQPAVACTPPRTATVI